MLHGKGPPGLILDLELLLESLLLWLLPQFETLLLHSQMLPLLD